MRIPSKGGVRVVPAIGVLLAASVLKAQEPRFEVASLKRNIIGSSSTSMDNRPEGLVMENGTLRNLIFNAYRPRRCCGPSSPRSCSCGRTTRCASSRCSI